MGKLGELAQDLYQVLQADLGRSTGTVGELGKADFAALHGCLLKLEGELKKTILQRL